MECEIQEWIQLTLPEHLKQQGSQLIEVCKNKEEKHPDKHCYRYGRRNSSRCSLKSESAVKSRSERVAIPIAIGELITELWSHRMQKHAENLILQKAVEEGYIEKHNLKWIHVLEDEKDEAEFQDTWLIDDRDDVIIKLLWDVFDIKTHYSQVKSHRLYVIGSYHRLKDFLPGLPEHLIQRHDLTKYAFSQAIGYTLKWVHSISNTTWKTARDFHVFNEPHHPQTWSKAHTHDEKQIKLLKWMSGCPYGMDVPSLDLNSEDFPEPFLLESYVDMVGVEWERRKGMDPNISTRCLAFIDDKFLRRYTKKQHQIISSLIERITASDESWEEVIQTDRERILLATVPSHRHGVYASHLEIQRKKEERRLVKSLSLESNKDSESLVSSSESVLNEAQTTYFYITVARVVLELWDDSFKNRVQKILLRKAIEEDLIRSDHVKWILIFEDNDGSESEPSHVDHTTVSDEDIITLLWNEFNLREHFIQVQRHRHWVKQSYLRLAHFMPEMCQEIIERHNLCKLSLSQSIGYTLRWIHNIDNSIMWESAIKLNVNCEPHHPEMWSNNNTVEHKQNCLERWLSDTDSYGVVVSNLDFHCEDMARVFLLQSLLDMTAVVWERNKEHQQDITNTQLTDIEEEVLSRYTPNDKNMLTHLIKLIRLADKSPDL